MSAAWQSLAVELRARDTHGDFGFVSDHPVSALVNSKTVSAAPYQDILIQALDWPMELGELEMVVRALSEKGITAATARLLSFFNDGSKKQACGFLWAVASAVHAIAGHDLLAETLAICQRSELGTARQMLVLHLSRFKKSEDVFRTLISLLEDDSVRGHALEALWRFGDARAVPAIEATPVRAGLYEAKAKDTALRKLKGPNKAGAANRSQPFGLQKNRTSSAAGSGG